MKKGGMAKITILSIVLNSILARLFIHRLDTAHSHQGFEQAITHPMIKNSAVNQTPHVTFAASSASMHTNQNGMKHNLYFETVNMPAPHMLQSGHLETWKSKHVSAWGGLEGQIWRAFNFSLPVPIPNCGFTSSRESFILNENSTQQNQYKRIAIALAPEAWSWQHFMQDVMPKIWFILNAVGGAQNIENDRVFLLPTARDSIIYEIMRFLRLSYTVEPTLPTQMVYVEDALIACKVPGVHPVLWQGIHSLLYVRQPATPQAVVISRRNSVNGRQEPNTIELLDSLGLKMPVQEFVGGSLVQAQTQLGGVSLMIGSQGGGLFNLMFMPSAACVIENQAHDVFHGISINPGNVEMFYLIATGVGQAYWRIVSESDMGYAFNVQLILEAVSQCTRLQ